MLGFPIAHSLSPILHRAAYAALGLTSWTYDAIECHAEDLEELVEQSGPEVVGYSCTMPLKRELLQVADGVSEEAAAIGAGNTLLHIEDEWFADNTDWVGIRDALAARQVAVSGRVAIIGAGGTAQAALAALPDAETVTVLVRDAGRAGELMDASARLERPIRLAGFDDIGEIDSAGLVISTVPAGAADPLAAALAKYRSGTALRKSQALLDVVYHPWPTPLAQLFLAGGATVVSGAEMLLYQAARQVELMTGRAAPVQAMREALAAATRDR